MFILLTLIPWILTIAALLFIVIKNKSDYVYEEYDDEDYEEYEEDFLEDIDEEVVRVAVYGDKAYWVYNNVFYESETVKEPDFTTARPIDTMSMSPKQLNKLLNILDELEEQERE